MTAEEKVKQVWPDAYCASRGHSGYIIRRPRTIDDKYSVLAFVTLGVHSWQDSEAEAWADASRRLGNEFVDEVGPLAERKEG